MRILDKKWKHDLFQIGAFVLVASMLNKAADGDMVLYLLSLAYLIGFGVSNFHEGEMRADVRNALRKKIAEKEAQDDKS